MEQRLVVVNANARQYGFWYGRRRVALYNSDRCLTPEEVENLRTTHDLPPKEAA
jgi:hypothetical protein